MFATQGGLEPGQKNHESYVTAPRDPTAPAVDSNFCQKSRFRLNVNFKTAQALGKVLELIWCFLCNKCLEYKDLQLSVMRLCHRLTLFPTAYFQDEKSSRFFYAVY